MTLATPGMPGFTCPRCHKYSEHPEHIKYGWCGYCHEYTGAPDNAADFAVWAETVKSGLALRWDVADGRDDIQNMREKRLDRYELRVDSLNRHYRILILLMVALVGYYGIAGTYFSWHVNPWLPAIPALIIILGIIWAVREWVTLRRAQIKNAFDPES